MSLAFSNKTLIEEDRGGNRGDLRSPKKLHLILAAITLDTDYPDGGYVLTPANFGLTTLEYVFPFQVAVTGAAGANFNGVWDPAAVTLKVHHGNIGTGVGAEVANGENAISGLVMFALAVGR